MSPQSTEAERDPVNRKRDQPCSLPDLVAHAAASDDPYACLAVHPVADEQPRAGLEAVMFRRRRDRLRWAGAVWTPASVLDALSTLEDPAIDLRLAKHPATPVRALDRIQARGCEVMVSVLMAGHPSSDSGRLARLLEVLGPPVAPVVAANPAAGRALLQRCLDMNPGCSAGAVALSPAADSALLARAWEQGDPYVQAEVALHPACPAALLAQAAASPLGLLRRKAAGNRGASKPMLLALCADPDPVVRAAAVGHPALTVGALMARCDDPDVMVRRRLARRRDVSEALVARLAVDQDPWVRRWLGRNGVVGAGWLDVLARDPVTEVRRAVGRNRQCPEALRERLAADPDPWVRAAVAFRTDLRADLAARLAGDDDIDVLAGLARNPATAPEVLMRLVCHPHEDVRRGLAHNPAAPADGVRRLLKDDYPFNRAAALGHCALGNGDIWFMTRDPEPRVRFTAWNVLVRRLRAGEKKRAQWRQMNGPAAPHMTDEVERTMKILIPIKQIAVLDEDFELRDDGRGVDPDYCDHDLNEWDEYSVEEALLIKEASASEVEVVVVTVGPDDADEALRKCLAKGADRAIRVWDDALEESDSLAIARVLAKVVEQESPDMVFAGTQSSDAACSATGVALASLLGWPHAAVVAKLEYVPGSDKAMVHRELEGGILEQAEIQCPSVLTIQLGINAPRYASLRGIKQAKSKQLDELSLGDLGLSAAEVGAQGSASRVRRMYVPEKGQAELIAGTPAEQARHLAEIIKEMRGM